MCNNQTAIGNNISQNQGDNGGAAVNSSQITIKNLKSISRQCGFIGGVIASIIANIIFYWLSNWLLK